MGTEDPQQEAQWHCDIFCQWGAKTLIEQTNYFYKETHNWQKNFDGDNFGRIQVTSVALDN